MNVKFRRRSFVSGKRVLNERNEWGEINVELFRHVAKQFNDGPIEIVGFFHVVRLIIIHNIYH